MVLRYLGEREGDGLISAREICDDLKIPFDTTAKVMQALNHHEILNSVKGIKGGYSLNKDLDSLSYMKMVEIVEGQVPESFCISNKGLCNLHNTCNIIGPLDRLNIKLTNYLSGLTIKEILFGDVEAPFKLEETP